MHNVVMNENATLALINIKYLNRVGGHFSIYGISSAFCIFTGMKNADKKVGRKKKVSF